MLIEMIFFTSGRALCKLNIVDFVKTSKDRVSIHEEDIKIVRSLCYVNKCFYTQ